MKLPFFDIFAAVVLVVGFFVGRKRGMSMELLPLFKILVVVVAGAQLYEPLGNKLAAASDGALSLLQSYIIVYVAFFLIVHMVFARLKTAVGEKLVGSDIFGSMEYYFGMGAGMLRFAGFLLFGLALLHAKPVDLVKEAQYRKVEKDNLGNIQFPTLASITMDVFKYSYSGKAVATHLPHLLIKETAPDLKVASTNKDQGIARKREAAVDEITKGPAKPSSTNK